MQDVADKSAIGLSILCALHCLLFPVAIIFYPNYSSILPNDEVVHFSILFIIIPVSIFALLRGSQIHKNSTIFVIGLLGILTLVLALILGHNMLGEFGEKIITLIGSIIVGFAHFRNFSICRSIDCSCHPEID